MLDLSKIRHDLRTPINHIIGYCEMLQEDESTPSSFQAELQKIHAGGRQLLAVIAEYFDEESFESRRQDLHRLCHELRTPVNHIIGYGEMLMDEARELDRKTVLPDLERITQAARTWLALMERYLLPREGEGSETSAFERSSQPALTLAEITSIPPVETTGSAAGRMPAATMSGRLLVVDDDEANRDMLGRRLRRQGFQISTASNGVNALELLHGEEFDLVLLDMLMPGLDGYQVLSRIKSDQTLADLPVIMLSALDQDDGIVRCIELGADDYIAKPFNPFFLRARIGACLDKKRLRDRERRTYQALLESQRRLAAELAEAAQYVRSLLPSPVDGPIRAEWCYHPSAQLGGDAFGYEWRDDRCFIFYLLDVCGHGVGAALLSVSIMNVLRAQTLPGVDFLDPSSVLAALNESFPMERQNNMFFTLWYGVYDRESRRLKFASGGHPPVFLVRDANSEQRTIQPLATANPAMGCFPEARFETDSCEVPAGAGLLLFSDGVYEVSKPDGTIWGLAAYQDFVASSAPSIALKPVEHFRRVHQLQNGKPLEDDFSLVSLKFAAH